MGAAAKSTEVYCADSSAGHVAAVGGGVFVRTRIKPVVASRLAYAFGIFTERVTPRSPSRLPGQHVVDGDMADDRPIQDDGHVLT